MLKFKNMSLIAALGLILTAPIAASAEEDASGYSQFSGKSVPAVSAVHEESSYTIEALRKPANTPDDSSKEKSNQDD